MSTEVVRWSGPSMGGRLDVVISAEPHRRAAAADAARRAGQRVNAWASHLTRFDEASDLMRLNRATEPSTQVRPTLGATLEWARIADERSDGVVDVTLLDERMAAKSGMATERGGGDWRLSGAGRASIVERSGDVQFDLDGVAKGWLADRAADLLSDWPGALVDADGDIALHAAQNVEWIVGVADPRGDDLPPLAELRLAGGQGWSRWFGVATSGTSVHRWERPDGRASHHLIDRRSGLPAETDLIQASVVATTAREAEMLAKAAVILGSARALPLLARSAALAAVLLTDDGELLALPGIEAWLA